MRRELAVLAGAVLVAACASTHIAPYTPKRRNYEVQEPPADVANDAPGSLFRSGRGTSILMTDNRAMHVNDVVVVRVEEIANARRTADTEVSRETKASADVSAFIQAMTAVTGATYGAKINASGGHGFDGTGATARTEKLTATVPALVRKLLPNGNLFVEGHRVVLVNQEEQHFYISGVVRPIDIDQQNSVKSSMIADAEIEFTGRGVMSDYQEPSWLSKALKWVWPF